MEGETRREDVNKRCAPSMCVDIHNPHTHKCAFITTVHKNTCVATMTKPSGTGARLGAEVAHTLLKHGPSWQSVCALQ